MQPQQERAARWAAIGQPWDVIVIGGGITGAAVLRETVRAGLRALLVEQRDWGWGTSSRSSKMVHGGARYLSQGKLGLVRDAAHERQRLLRDGPGLVTPLGFVLAHFRGDRPPVWLNQLGMALYDALAGQWNHQRLDTGGLRFLAPHLSPTNLVGALRYGEATTDDARLVLRLIREAARAGGAALNYVAATELLREQGTVVGVRLRDEVSGTTADVRAKAVINATGVWVDGMRAQVGGAPKMRPLRGSHLLFPAWRFPVAQAIAFGHPLDGRYVYALPWEGATLVGTTDLDHRDSVDREPAIRADEVAYLMAAVEATFPALALTLDDALSTFSGLRPVVDTGQPDPSRESRDHLVLDEQGLVTVTGGKLTTFRLIALDALEALRPRLPHLPPPDRARPIFDPVPPTLRAPLPDAARLRLLGRYGADATALVAAAPPGDLEVVSATPTLWAELRWAARHEAVVHLDDLLLRRTRLGLLLPDGGAALLPDIRARCQPELGWDDARWDVEQQRYATLWRTHYSLPPRDTIPDWRAMVADHPRPPARPARRWQRMVAAALALGVGLLWRRTR